MDKVELSSRAVLKVYEIGGRPCRPFRHSFTPYDMHLKGAPCLRVSEPPRLYAGLWHPVYGLEVFWTVEPSRRAVGVAHVAFEVPDRTTFATAHRRLLEAAVPIIARDNRISWAFRFKDPDGNEIEIYLDRRNAPGGTALWEGRCHGPLSAQKPVAPGLSVAAQEGECLELAGPGLVAEWHGRGYRRTLCGLPSLLKAASARRNSLQVSEGDESFMLYA